MNSFLSVALREVADVLHILLSLYILILVVRVLLSWANPDPRNIFVRFLSVTTDPAMSLARRWMSFRWNMIDFSPLLLFSVLIFLQVALISTLKDFSLLVVRPTEISIALSVVFGNCLLGIAAIGKMFCGFFLFFMLIRFVLELVHADESNMLVRIVVAATDPLVFMVRKTIKASFGPVDLAILVVLGALLVCEYFLLPLLVYFGMFMRGIS